MSAANTELGLAVDEVLAWLDASPEAAAAALGINVCTLNAMRQGIVPMRSLVIRFAEGIGRRCKERPGAQSWWTDVDAWLARAGYQARREPGHTAPHAGPARDHTPLPEPPPDRAARLPAAPAPAAPMRAAAPAPAPSMQPRESAAPPNAMRAKSAPPPQEPAGPPAGEFYRPIYERVPWGDTFVHVFWIVDPTGAKIFKRHMGANVDYKAEATRLKQDLASMPRDQFERKYGRFRVQ